MIRRAIRLAAVLAAFASVAGCATYGQGMDSTLVQVEQGRYQEAGQSLRENLSPDGEDALLYDLELGVIEHLAGNYQASNKHLERANRLAEDLKSRRGEDYLAAAMTNPRDMAYGGAAFERVYINYYKALNYLMLAQQAEVPAARSKQLGNARVEIRRLDNKLNAISFEQGNYKNVKDREQKTFVKLWDLFQKFQGNWLDADWLVFREDAYARYLAGVLFEKNGEFDEARVSYQNAAKLYEEGYQKQYHLGGGMAEQAWFDTIRMMRRSGGWEGEWPRLARRKLSPGMRDKLDAFGPERAQLLVVQHLGMVPQRKELNLHLTADPHARSLELRPVPTGDIREEKDQLAWFFLLYGDKGVMDMLEGFQSGGLAGVAHTVTRKTVPLGPAWNLAEQLKIPQAVGPEGIRVTVPYYSPLRTGANGSRFRVDGKSVDELRQAESLSQIAVQEQLLSASSDLYGALARATLKNVLAAETGSALGGGLGRLGMKLVAAGTSAAETRNWLTLPYGIRLARVAVAPGEHRMVLTTYSQAGAELDQSQKTVTVRPGEVRVWVVRTTDPTQDRPHGKQVKTASN